MFLFLALLFNACVFVARGEVVPAPEWSLNGQLPRTVDSDRSFLRFSTRNGESSHLSQMFQLEQIVSIPNARQMALNKDGTVMFVGSRIPHEFSSVYAVFLNVIPDVINGETGVPEYSIRPTSVVTVVSNLPMPSGVAYDDDTDTLFVAAVDGILRYDRAVERLRENPERELTGRMVFETPNGKVHTWKYLKIIRSADGSSKRLVFPIGSPCDSCETQLPFSTINSIEFDGSGLVQHARGVRNSVGFDQQPGAHNAGRLWFTENANDEQGEVPCDEYNLIENMFSVDGVNDTADIPSYGFPYCDGFNSPNPEFNEDGDCSAHIPAEYCLGKHVAALGVAFYDTSLYKLMPRQLVGSNGTVAFIAEHGSWNIEPKTGYRITTVDISDTAAGSYQTFIEGFANMEPEGRPVDVVVFPADGGSLLISDDKQGTVYRVTYGYRNAPPGSGWDGPMSGGSTFSDGGGPLSLLLVMLFLLLLLQ